MTDTAPGPRRGRLEDRWVLRRHPEPGARLRLFCLPHAGGDTWMFADWHRSLAPEVEVCPIRLPGRGSRMSEPPFEDVRALVRAIAEGLGDLLDDPFAIFGHSMGALIGFELARLLWRERGRAPAMLCVAACRAPRLVREMPTYSHLPPYMLIEALHRRYGVYGDMGGNEELMRLMLPTLRADLKICETYATEDEARVACPIAAYGGIGDATTNAAAIDAWQDDTSDAFRAQMLSGGHFFPIEAKAELLVTLKSDLAWALSGGDHPL